MPGSHRNEFYKGARRTRRYFEGWYFKQVSADRTHAWSFIPGLSLGDKAGEGYSFVQVIEGRTGRTWWFQYGLDAFRASEDSLDISVGDSSFTARGIHLDLEGPEGSFRGDLSYGPFTELPRKPLWPGVMGPFAFMPFMECRHGLLSLDHEVSGSFVADGRRISMGGAGIPGRAGRGYIEKDWGSSMPSSWIWMQSNNFAAEGDSFMLSIADIPWLGSAFTGFLCAGRLGGRFLREATYTGAKLADFRLRDGSVGLGATRSRGGLLRAPVKGLLTRRISESVDAVLSLRWSKAGRTLFEGEASGAGLELVGDPRFLFERIPGRSALGSRIEADNEA